MPKLSSLHNSPKLSRAFSLIEILISLMMVGGLVVLLLSATGTLKIRSRSNDHNTAARWIADEFDKYRSDNFTDFVGMQWIACEYRIEEIAQSFTGQVAGAHSSNLVGHWKLDETSGSTAVDSSSSGNNGTITSFPNWTTGQLGGALQLLDTTLNYVNLANEPNPPGLNLNRDFTLEAWVKPDTIVGNDAIISHGSDKWYLRLKNGRIEFLDSWNAMLLASNTNLTAGIWTHVAVTVGSGTDAPVTLYKNGIPDSTPGFTTNITFDDTDPVHGDENVTIGAEREGTADPFGGLIDDVRVYNITLTQSDIQQDMVPPPSPSPTPTPPPPNTEINAYTISYPAGDPTPAPGNPGWAEPQEETAGLRKGCFNKKLYDSDTNLVVDAETKLVKIQLEIKWVDANNISQSLTSESLIYENGL